MKVHVYGTILNGLQQVAKADGEDEDGEDTNIEDEGEQEETGAM